MGLKVISEHLNGLIVLQPDVFEDHRGFFYESYRASDLENAGIPTNFVQDNHSRSARGVLRGMHFQWNEPQGKLIRVTVGTAQVAEIDIRPGSPTFGQWWSEEISAENKLIVWVPPGFANGFICQSDWVEMQYKCTAYWNKNCEGAILWNDPAVGIEWGIDEPSLSEKDTKAFKLSEWILMNESQNLNYNLLKRQK